MNRNYIYFFICLTPFHYSSTHIEIKKVVLWGHKLHTHTHSYIHWAFKRAFTHLGYDTYWLDNRDDIKGIDFKGALFITEGQVDQNIPIRKDAFYILHNCNNERYREAFNDGRAIQLQVFTRDALDKGVKKYAPYIFYNLEKKIIFMPWATDLLPDEIDQQKNKLHSPRLPFVSFIGSVGGGVFGNQQEIDGFKKAVAENGIHFQVKINLSMQQNIDLIQKSFFAPAIQGKWQCEKGYIPCRIFKNISYGQMGITNCEAVYNLFNKKIVYNPNTYQLFYDAKRALESYSHAKQIELMDFVRDNHTYLNRIEALLHFLNIVNSEAMKLLR